MTRVGIIGTGMLGEAVGLHLLEKHISLYAYNRTIQKTNKLKQKGAIVCGTPKEVAQNSDIVITVVKDADAVKHVSFETNGIIHGIHDGLVVADMSTIHPVQSTHILEKFKAHNIAVLDIPVMGGPNVAISGELTMMASGDKSAFNQYKNILDLIAKKVFYLGEGTVAHTVKLAMNLQISMIALGLSEGIALLDAAKIDPKIFLDILNSTYFGTGMSQNKAFKMIKNEYPPTFTLQNLKKDLYTINQTSESFGTSLPMAAKALEVYEDAVKNGFGNLDYTGVLAHIKKISGLDSSVQS